MQPPQQQQQPDLSIQQMRQQRDAPMQQQLQPPQRAFPMARAGSGGGAGPRTMPSVIGGGMRPGPDSRGGYDQGGDAGSTFVDDGSYLDAGPAGDAGGWGYGGEEEEGGDGYANFFEEQGGDEGGPMGHHGGHMGGGGGGGGGGVLDLLGAGYGQPGGLRWAGALVLAENCV